jgi:hypothetical protein
MPFVGCLSLCLGTFRTCGHVCDQVLSGRGGWFVMRELGAVLDRKGAPAPSVGHQTQHRRRIISAASSCVSAMARGQRDCGLRGHHEAALSGCAVVKVGHAFFAFDFLRLNDVFVGQFS